MKTINLILSGAAAYYLYKILTEKENSGPVQQENQNLNQPNLINTEKEIKASDLKDNAESKINTIVSNLTQSNVNKNKQQNTKLTQSTVSISDEKIIKTKNRNEEYCVDSTLMLLDIPILDDNLASSIFSNYFKKSNNFDRYGRILHSSIEKNNKETSENKIGPFYSERNAGLHGNESNGISNKDLKVVSKNISTDELSKLIKRSESYELQDIPFLYLSENTKTILIQCYAQDYTSPRMIKDDKLYDTAIAAANKTGAPAGWLQYLVCILVTNGVKAEFITFDKLFSAGKLMLDTVENSVANNKNINLEDLRKDAILKGLHYA